MENIYNNVQNKKPEKEYKDIKIKIIIELIITNKKFIKLALLNIK